MADIYKRTSADTLSLQELALYHEIMAYRAENGLGPVKLSKALTTTAARHVIDTRENILSEGGIPEGQSLHTWSDAPYYANGSNPRAMWDAPARLETGYEDAGYEISAAGQATIGEALEGWQGSRLHDNVILNRDVWETVDYGAIGVGVDTSPADDPYRGRVFHVWFGEDPDLTGIPRIMGTRSDEQIRGTAFADDIRAEGGDDRVSGYGGDDLLRGGTGGDTLYGGSGDDRLYGGDHRDRLRGNDGNDRLYGGDGDDDLRGGNHRDRLSGGSGDDDLRGGNGWDRLLGGSGDDVLRGGNGSDTLKGGSGDDVLHGGRGRDLLVGGSGEDVFVFRSRSDAGKGEWRDEIEDFQLGLDRIDLSRIDADLTRDGDQTFAFTLRPLSDDAGRLSYRESRLSADMDGDGRADFQIAIGNGAALGAEDFIL